MKQTLTEGRLAELSGYVAAKTALHFPRERWRDLELKATAAALDYGYPNVNEFVSWLFSHDLAAPEAEILASHLTISETYFWREPCAFDALIQQILPALMASRNPGDERLRIWSAGCSSGEEPYSIAMAIRQVIPAADDWNITILATDINPRILRRAQAGIYGEWSFRNVPEWLKSRNFQRLPGGKYEIAPAIRKMVSYAYLNLAEDVYPSPMNNTQAVDIIFCRNVLMYFSPERAMRVGEKFHRALTEGGWLILGASELSQKLFPQFSTVNFPGAFLYRKDNLAAQPPTAYDLAETPASTFSLPVETDAQAAGIHHEAHSIYEPLAPVNGKVHSGVPVRDPVRPETVKVDLEFQVRQYADQGKLAEALKACELAIEADKLNPGLHFLHAAILLELNRDEAAGASLKRALYIDPAFVMAHFALGNLMLKRRNAGAARKFFENALSLLGNLEEGHPIPEAEGLTAKRLGEVIHATLEAGTQP